ncbi:sugar ABC transporter substrate-binding protein [Paenibacillus agaridevorans]|uniref:Sugar ABC transporter substrate-binding protein n=1 Tax=Paenibacillus agaridevorans TaxID=171404 RepID=A0A2R5EZU0_9BACL|nr:extracellular solute-binding protein [Paenibacillus agaridevorans]GBG10608.1 sugar ABC transporter substrate-binding protein [Paenibacillus agaridevorans]
MKVTKPAFTMLSILTTASLLAACASSPADPSPTPASTASPKADDMNKKYAVKAMTILYGNPPAASGYGIQAINERYNIDFQFNSVPSGDYNNKLATAFASGNIPDITLIEDSTQTFYNYAEAGAFLPLEDYIKDYPNLSKIPQDVLDLMTYKGHLYGIPRIRAASNWVLSIRKDWLDKLNLPMPTTYEELTNVMKAFTENDPDGNGQKDTYGMAMSYASGFISSVAAFTPTKVMPFQSWVEDGKGGILPGWAAPNGRELVKLVTDWYREGYISKDFVLMKSSQSEEDFLLGKAGIHGDFAFNAYSPERLNKARAANPDFQWDVVPPLTALDGTEGSYSLGSGFYGFNVLSAKAGSDEGKVHRLLQILDDQMNASGIVPFGDGEEGVHFTNNADGTKSYTSLGNSERPGLYLLTNPIPEGDFLINPSLPDEIKQIQKKAIDTALSGTPYKDASLGVISKTKIDKGEELSKFLLDGVVNIIVNGEPIDNYDLLIEEWKTRGADQMIQEMNESYKAKNAK